MSEVFGFENIKDKIIRRLKVSKPSLGKDEAFAPLLEGILELGSGSSDSLAWHYSSQSNGGKGCAASRIIYDVIAMGQGKAQRLAWHFFHKLKDYNFKASRGHSYLL